MPLPPYYLKLILTSGMACIITKMMYGGGIFQVLFESFSKGPGGFPYVFIITGEVTTLEPVYGLTFADHGSLSLEETSRFLMVLLPLKWVCMPYLPQICLILSQRPCCKVYQCDPSFNFIGSDLGICSAMICWPYH